MLLAIIAIAIFDLASSYVSYYWNFVPWYVFPVIAIILVAVFWEFIAPFWMMLPKPVKVFFAGVVAVLLAAQWGRNRGMKDAQAMRDKDNANAIKERENIDATVKDMQPNAVDDSLKRHGWMRDDK